jgi:hypothetical protein
VKSYLSQRLGSAELDEEDVESYTKEGLEEFINFAKPKFAGTEDILNIKVGKRKLNVPSININGGRMKLMGFVPSSRNLHSSERVFCCFKIDCKVGLRWVRRTHIGQHCVTGFGCQISREYTSPS